MRHHRCPDDSRRDIEHFGVLQQHCVRDQPLCHVNQIGLCQNEFRPKGQSDHRHHGDDKGFELAKTLPLQSKNQKHIQHRNAKRDQQWQAKQ